LDQGAMFLRCLAIRLMPARRDATLIRDGAILVLAARCPRPAIRQPLRPDYRSNPCHSRAVCAKTALLHADILIAAHAPMAEDQLIRSSCRANRHRTAWMPQTDGKVIVKLAEFWRAQIKSRLFQCAERAG
jgi:hypothetical protein